MRLQLAGGVQHISSRGYAFAAVKEDGSVVTWGDEDYFEGDREAARWQESQIA